MAAQVPSFSSFAMTKGEDVLLDQLSIHSADAVTQARKLWHEFSTFDFDNLRYGNLNVTSGGVDFYDIVVKPVPVVSIVEEGWKVKKSKQLIDWEPRYKGTKFITVVGEFNAGKTHIVSKLLKKQLPSGYAVHTEGLSIAVKPEVDGADTKAINLIAVVDTAGKNSPFHSTNGIKSTEMRKNVEVRCELEEMLRQSELLKDIAINLGQVFVIVVPQLSNRTQKEVTELIRCLETTKNLENLNVFVVHNLKDHTVEHVEKDYARSVVGVFGGKLLQSKGYALRVEKQVSGKGNSKVTITHLFLSDENRLTHNNDIAVNHIWNSLANVHCKTEKVSKTKTEKVSELVWSQITKSIGRFISIPTEFIVRHHPTEFCLRCYTKQGGELLSKEHRRLTPFNIDVLDADVQGMIYGNMVKFQHTTTSPNGRSDKREYRVFEFPIPSTNFPSEVEINELQTNLSTTWITLKDPDAAREALFTPAAKLKVAHTCATVVEALRDEGATLLPANNDDDIETTRASSKPTDVDLQFQFRTDQANFNTWQRYTEDTEPTESPVFANVMVKSGLLLLELISDPI